MRARDFFSCYKRQGEDERKETVEENEAGRGKIFMHFGTWNKQNTNRHAAPMHILMTKLKYNQHSNSVDARGIQHLRNEREFTLFPL